MKKIGIIISIIVSTIIILGSFTIKYYNKEMENDKLRMNSEKEKYVSLSNPYYLDQEILSGRSVENTLVSFMKNKSMYYQAQDKFDKGNPEEAIYFLNKMTSRSFDSLKYDLMGDINMSIGEKDAARGFYESAMNNISENKILKEAVFSKYQKTFK